MYFWGKLLGGGFGYLLAGPFGALAGLALGHFFDRGLSRAVAEEAKIDPAEIQAVFFEATFSIMGHIAKADGRVSEIEIAMAETVMARLQLNAEQRKEAIGYFNQGKSPEFDADAMLDRFIKLCRRRRQLTRVFLEIQISLAMADGELDPAEREQLGAVCSKLGLPKIMLDRLIQMLLAQQQYAGKRHQGTQVNINDAYAVLGVDSKASDDEVKKAYRKLMNQNHPDKLMAKGVPEEMIKLATERTQEIKTAYEEIKKYRSAAAA